MTSSAAKHSKKGISSFDVNITHTFSKLYRIVYAASGYVYSLNCLHREHINNSQKPFPTWLQTSGLALEYGQDDYQWHYSSIECSFNAASWAKNGCHILCQMCSKAGSNVGMSSHLLLMSYAYMTFYVMHNEV